MKLNELTSGSVAKILQVHSAPTMKRRLYELGIIPNDYVQIINISPMRRAYLIKIHGSIFALRSEIVQSIEVEPFE